MPRRVRSPVSLFDPELADPGCLEPSPLWWLLARRGALPRVAARRLGAARTV